MDRREQIRTAAEKASRGVGGNWEHIRKGAELWFIRGAIWADSHPHWIPVEEQLPKLTIDSWRSEEVFFATDDGKSHFGFYSNKGVWFSSVYGFNGHQVTHWMSLPQAPRKED